MPDIYIRTGPFDDAPQSQGSFGDVSDPWAAFPDVPSHFAAPGMSGDPWAAFPDWPSATSNINNSGAALPASLLSRYAHSAGPFTSVPNQNNIQLSGSRSDNMSHCLPSYVLCQEYHGSGPMISGKHCGDCLDMCLRNDYWPRQYCPL
jgi:hypothetical protein